MSPDAGRKEIARLKGENERLRRDNQSLREVIRKNLPERTKFLRIRYARLTALDDALCIDINNE